jgi:hypothetical protein
MADQRFYGLCASALGGREHGVVKCCTPDLRPDGEADDDDELAIDVATS